MPTVAGYFDCELDGRLVTTALGVTLTVADRETGSPVCAVRLTRAELRAALRTADALAAAVAADRDTPADALNLYPG